MKDQSYDKFTVNKITDGVSIALDQFTCTPTERAFLDEIREKYKLKIEKTNGVSYVYLENVPSIIYQSDFTKCNLQELVEGKG